MFEMKPEYYIGIDMIDQEHAQLFAYADEAYELLHDEFTPDKYDKINLILEKLRDYTKKHFADEEAYMESIHYKKIFTQKVQHQQFIEKLTDMLLFLIPNYVKEGKYQLVVAIGCTGGKHRSVTLANELYARLRNQGNYGLTILHRDIKNGIG